MAARKIERRASRRYAFTMPARFKAGKRTLSARVSSVGRHGVFVETGAPRKKDELFQLVLDVPSLMDETSVEIRVMAVVAWAACAPGQCPGRGTGMGVKFFMMSAEDKARWDRFYAALEHKMEPELDQRRVVASRFGPPKFYLRPRDFLQMFRFQKHSLTGGHYFLRSPFQVPNGEHLQVVMIHPDSKEEFPLTGIVAGAVTTGPVSLRGMHLRWCNVMRSTHLDFQRFILDGIHPIEEIALRLAS